MKKKIIIIALAAVCLVSVGMFFAVNRAAKEQADSIDITLVDEERIREFIRQIKNPYCFKVDGVAVSVGFSDDGVTFRNEPNGYKS